MIQLNHDDLVDYDNHLQNIMAWELREDLNDIYNQINDNKEVVALIEKCYKDPLNYEFEINELMKKWKH